MSRVFVVKAKSVPTANELKLDGGCTLPRTPNFPTRPCINGTFTRTLFTFLFLKFF